MFFFGVMDRQNTALINKPMSTQVTKELLQYKNKISPYQGMTLTGRVEKTYLRGSLVYDRTAGGFTGLPPRGRLL